MDEFLIALQRLAEEDLVDFCRKKVLHGIPHVFKDREEDLYEFRKMIANNFNVNFFDVYITGSAKLGFNPHKKTVFSLDSDIDVAIVSEQLFSEMMNHVCSYQFELRKGRHTVSEVELKQYHSFLEYSAIGWIRPDKLPTSFMMRAIRNEWFDYFTSLSHGKSGVGNYKVSGGVFQTYSHLELYLVDGYKTLKNKLKVEQDHVPSN